MVVINQLRERNVNNWWSTIDGSGTYTSEHAWGSSAHLQVILAHLGSVEHGVEGGDLVYLHLGHFEDLGSLVHGWQGQEVVVLLLGDEEDGDYGWGFVVVGVLGQKNVNCFVWLLSEFKWRLLKIIFSVSVVGECTKLSYRLCCHHSHSLGKVWSSR